MPLFKLPRFVALDSSHLASWAQDWWCQDRVRQDRAKAFEQHLATSGWVPLICFHHLAELLAHGDEGVIGQRIEFLCQLDVLGWVAHQGGESFPGLIVDVLAAELEAALALPDATPGKVRDRARPNIVRVGTGQEAIGGFRPIWRDLLPHLRAQAEEARHDVAVTRAKAVDVSGWKVADILKGRFKDPADRDAALTAMKTRLGEQVRTRGDRRISDAGQVAESFVSRVETTAASLPSDFRSFVMAGLAAKNIEPEDIGPDTTLGDLDDIGIFRGQLKVAAEVLNRPWPLVKDRVQPDQFPSWIIDRGLRKFGQDVPERKGSDLNDGYLLALAAYADLTLVDKRTLENVKRARTGSSAFADIVGQVAKAPSYTDLITILPD